MIKISILLSVLIIALSLISGCVPSKPVEETEILPSERLINKLEANRRRIKNFQGNGTLFIKTSGMENSASFQVVVLKPDSIYMTILGPFGIELAQILVSNEKFKFYDALQNTVYTGDLSEDILREIFKVDISFKDLIDAFIGSINLSDKLYRNPDRYEVVYDQYILTYIDSLTGVSSEYTVDVRELGIRNFRLLEDEDNILLEGKYSEFDLIETVAIPLKIEIKNKRKNQTLTIDYKNIAANKRNIFINFTVPDDASEIKW